jgi:hypothetical protein
MNEELTQQPVETPTEQPVAAQPAPQSDREYNFKVMRERAEAAERRAMELERLQQQKQAEQPDGLPDDDMYVEAKHLKKYKSTLNDVQEELKATRKQLEQFGNRAAEDSVRSKFNDFDVMVNDENMGKLASTKPALYRSILSNPDLKDKLETAYDAISTFVQPTKYASQDKKLEENKTKPRSSATVSPQASESPLARTDDYDRRTLSKDRKEELYREMMQAAKRR